MTTTPIKLNGRTYDFTSLRPSGLPPGLDDSLFTAYLRGVNFGDTITPSIPGGVHGIPLPRGRGNYAANASLDLVFEAWDAFTKSCAQNRITGITDFDFDLRIDVITQGRSSLIEIMEASFLGVTGAWARGNADGLTITVPIYTRYLLINGVCAYSLDLDQDLSTESTGGVSLGI